MARSNSDRSLESCVWSFVLEYTKMLQKCGYETFIEEHPKIAVGHVLKRISYSQLKNRMVITAKLEKEEDFRKNCNALYRRLASEAKLIDRMYTAKDYKPHAEEFSELSCRLRMNPHPNLPTLRQGVQAIAVAGKTSEAATSGLAALHNQL